MNEMGEVVAVIKILPTEVEVFDSMKEKVLSLGLEITAQKEEPIAFGLKSFNVTVVVKDGAGGTEPIEQKIAAVEGVGDVQVIGLARL